MMRSKTETSISWADEVEKEEEEQAARAQVSEKQKPNPYGSARPREVVLQERGIDWRKLDEDFRTPSHLSIRTQKEKPLKENITPSAALVSVDRNQTMPQSNSSRGPEQKLKNAKMASYGSKVSRRPQNPQNHTSAVFVPPLKHPPRALLLNLFPQTHCPHYSPPLFHTLPKKIQNKNHIEHENVPKDYELGMEQFQNCNVSRHGRHIHGYNGGHNQHKVVLEHDSAQHGTFDNGRRNFEVKCPPEAFGNARRRGVLNDRYMYEEKSCFQGHCNSRMAMSAIEKIRWEKMGGESEWQSFPGKCVGGGRAETIISGGRAETSHTKEMKRADYNGNYKKRERSSGIDNSHYHHRKGREEKRR